MFALSPIAITPTALSASPSALAVPASDLVSTRTSSTGVPAPLSNNAVENEARNATALPSPAAEAESAHAQTGSVTIAGSGNTIASGPSSTFLTQLLSQGGATEDSQIALASSYARFAPAPSYTTFIGYGVVKFRPSNAGLPSAYAPATDTGDSENDNAPVALPANDYQAYSATQTRNQSNLSSGTEPQIVVAG